MIVKFNKQQLQSELFNRDHFESLLNSIFLPQKSENVQPHSSQSSHKNETPSSGTSPLASYKEVPHPPEVFRNQMTEADSS